MVSIETELKQHKKLRRLFIFDIFFSQMDEVIDNIISMQSSYDDVQAYIDSVQMPNTVSRASPAKTVDIHCSL